ncbi:PLASTIDIC GLUCOSE TRANSPORTER 4 [Salix koriyanagi]|uniref:PLASTIDIC GLUCOSE TRANSPORTER 4 n=1 Tax=Salix koriyanagi TaxID=2511006 RepID=A0A9Q0ZLA8_9ROSI|nr:PLASTIDIC GLUCOSE TRANSPORTER 4 [Salix koriyanagi]
MQAAVMYGGVVVKGSVNSNSTRQVVCFSRAQEGRKQKQLSSSIDFSSTHCQLLPSSSCMPRRTSCFGLRLDSSSSMGTELTSSSFFRSRPIVKALASGGGGDVEEGRPIKSDEDVNYVVPPQQQQGKASTGTVLPFVGVACLGATLFGYHLGVVNGALEYLAKDLGIVENTALQGWIVSTLLAGATVGSFTGGALADKFGRTRTFQLDAIPLTIGALLCATAHSVQTMIIGRLLAGIGIGISSAIVPLYISEISPTEIRGALGSVNQLFICIGILLALVAGLPLAGNSIWYVLYAFFNGCVRNCYA